MDDGARIIGVQATRIGGLTFASWSVERPRRTGMDRLGVDQDLNLVATGLVLL